MAEHFIPIATPAEKELQKAIVRRRGFRSAVEVEEPQISKRLAPGSGGEAGGRFPGPGPEPQPTNVAPPPPPREPLGPFLAGMFDGPAFESSAARRARFATQRQEELDEARAARHVVVTPKGEFLSGPGLLERFSAAKERESRPPEPRPAGESAPESFDDVLEEMFPPSSQDVLGIPVPTRLIEVLNIVQFLDETTVGLLLALTSPAHQERFREMRQAGFSLGQAARQSYEEIPRAARLKLFEQILLSPLNAIPIIGFPGLVTKVGRAVAAQQVRAIAQKAIDFTAGVPVAQRAIIEGGGRVQASGLDIAGRLVDVPSGGAITLPRNEATARIRRFNEPALEARSKATKAKVEDAGFEYDALAGMRDDEFFIALEPKAKGTESLLARADSKAGARRTEIGLDAGGLSVTQRLKLQEQFSATPEARLARSLRERNALFFRSFDDVDEFLRTLDYKPPTIESPLRTGPVKKLYKAAAPTTTRPFTSPAPRARSAAGDEPTAQALQAKLGDEGIDIRAGGRLGLQPTETAGAETFSVNLKVDDVARDIELDRGAFQAQDIGRGIVVHREFEMVNGKPVLTRPARFKVTHAVTGLAMGDVYKKPIAEALARALDNVTDFSKVTAKGVPDEVSGELRNLIRLASDENIEGLEALTKATPARDVTPARKRGARGTRAPTATGASELPQFELLRKRNFSLGTLDQEIEQALSIQPGLLAGAGRAVDGMVFDGILKARLFKVLENVGVDGQVQQIADALDNLMRRMVDAPQSRPQPRRTFGRVVEETTDPIQEDFRVVIETLERIKERVGGKLEGAPAAVAAQIEVPRGAATPSLPRELAGAKPRYGYGSRNFTLAFDSDVDRALFIVSQAKKSKADASYVRWLEETVGIPVAEARVAGGVIRDRIKEIARTASRDSDNLVVPASTQPGAARAVTQGAGRVASDDAAAALPTNADGTVTLLHGTTPEGAVAIRRSNALLGKEDGVFLTTDRAAASEFGPEVVEVRVNPNRLTLDDEFPSGRKDFRIPAKIGETVPVEVVEATPRPAPRSRTVVRTQPSTVPPAAAVAPSELLAIAAPPERLALQPPAPRGATPLGPGEPPPPVDVAPPPPSGGVPPPSGGVPPEFGGVPPRPRDVTPPRAARALTRGSVVQQQDKAGAVSDLFDHIPFVKKLRRQERPGLALNDEMLGAHIAARGVNAEVGTEAFSTRPPLFRGLDQAFGKGAADGKVTNAPFIGTASERNSIVGKFKDIADRPALYDLTPEQRAYIARFEERNEGLRVTVNDGYGTDIGHFQANEGGAYTPNLDVGEQALETMEILGGLPSRSMSGGKSKPRIYDTAHDRMVVDPEFLPEVNIRILVQRMDEAKATAAAAETFRRGVGGKNLLEVMQETHPQLAAKMAGVQRHLETVRGRLARTESKIDEAIDEFNASPMADEDISTLQDVLDLELTQGIHAMDIPVIKADLEAAKAAVVDLRKAWKGANLRGWRFVQGGNNGIYRYFPTEDAVRLEKLLQTSNAGGAAEFIDRVRATVLTADTSPITGVQAPMSFLFDPYGASKQWIGGLTKSVASGNPFRAFSQTAFAEDIAEHLDEWQELFYYLGRAPTSRPEEMVGSFIESIPKIGGIVRRGNEDMYIGIIRRVKRMVDEERDSLMKHMGLSHDEAMAAAVDSVTKVIPIQNTARLGQSGRQAQLARLPFTSIAFLRKPIELNLDAARGFTKLLTKQTLTPRERLAVKFALTMASSVTAISVSTALYSADLRGTDKLQAIKDTLPGGKYFMSIVLPNGNSIPIGGPYRSLINALVPRSVLGSDFPVPFAGLGRFIEGRVTPALRAPLEAYRNRDYFGRKIIDLEHAGIAENALRIFAYGLENTVPLTAGEVISAVRTGEELSGVGGAVISQFLGGSLREETVFQERNADVQRWGAQQGIEALTYFDLKPSEKKAYDEANPEFTEAVKVEPRTHPLDTGRGRSQEGRIRRQAIEDKHYAMEVGAVTMMAEEWRPQQFADDLHRIADQRFAAKEGVNAALGLFQGEQEPSDDPLKQSLNEFYALFAKATTASDGFDHDKFELLLREQQYKWTPEQRLHVENETGLREHPPLVEERLNAMERLGDYFEVGEDYKLVSLQADALWQEYMKAGQARRRVLMLQNPGLRDVVEKQSEERIQLIAETPALDCDLVRWFQDRAHTRACEDLYLDLYRDQVPLGGFPAAPEGAPAGMRTRGGSTAPAGMRTRGGRSVAP